VTPGDGTGTTQQTRPKQEQQPSTGDCYGDPDTTPVVYASGRSGDLQIAVTVDGIVYAHCVRVVETVLRGCSGSKSSTNGLLDAVTVHRDIVSTVLIKIDRASNARRIA
jgi:hypothetical protein